MAKPEEKPDEKEPKEDAPAQAESPSPLSDEDVEKLFANIGEEAAQAAEGTPPNEGEPKEPSADSPPPTFDPAMLQTSEGQKAIKDAVSGIIASQKDDAATEEQRKELQELIDSNNIDELGKRYLKSLETQTAGQTAVDAHLTTLYRELFSDPMFQNLTAEERKEIEPDARFRTDAEYVKHLSKFMAAKLKTSISEEDLNAALVERREALKRNAAAEKAVKGSVQGAAPAEGTKEPRPTDARSLISEGLRETFPDAYAQ